MNFNKIGRSLQVTHGGTAFLYLPCIGGLQHEHSPQRALTALDNRIRDAVRQSRLAYEYCPNSYTHRSLSACLAAENALEVSRRTSASKAGLN